MLIWIPKRGKERGWSFYSVTVPVSLILIVVVLLVLFVLRMLGM